MSNHRSRPRSPDARKAGVFVTCLAALLVLAAGAAEGAGSGIDALVKVSQMKASNANDEALQGADKQRDLVQEKKKVRKAARHAADAKPVRAEQAPPARIRRR